MSAEKKTASKSTGEDKSLVGRIKTLPGAIAVTVVTALVGALIAYFVPGILNDVTGKDQLKVSLESNPATIDTFHDVSQHLIAPRGHAVSGSPGAGCTGFHSWGETIGAVPAGETNLRLVVQGGGAQTLIEGIRARVIERDRPLDGTGFVCPSQAGLRPRSVCINLDDPSPIGQVVKYTSVAKRCTGKPVSFTVSENETEVFDISAITSECYCKWILELVTTQSGSQKTISVPSDGQPFETTAWPESPSRPHYLWDLFASRWQDYPNGRTYSADSAQLPPLPTFAPGVRGGPLFQP